MKVSSVDERQRVTVISHTSLNFVFMLEHQPIKTLHVTDMVFGIVGLLEYEYKIVIRKALGYKIQTGTLIFIMYLINNKNRLPSLQI